MKAVVKECFTCIDGGQAKSAPRGGVIDIDDKAVYAELLALGYIAEAEKKTAKKAEK